MSSQSYKKELKIAIAAVKASEPTFRKYFGTETKVQTKDGDFRNIATLADRKIERDVKNYLARRFPDYGFIGEENGHFPTRSAYSWVLDPVDGTSNYVHGHPECAISLALLKNKKPVMAVVFAPALNELYIARLGAGATCNGKKLKVSKISDVKRSFGAIGWSRNLNFAVWLFSKILTHILTTRVAGSGTMALCYTAKGTYDFFVGRGGSAIWDTAPGELIIKEAGGSFMSNSKIQIAANKTLAAKLFRLFK